MINNLCNLNLDPTEVGAALGVLAAAIIGIAIEDAAEKRSGVAAVITIEDAPKKRSGVIR